MRLPSIVLAAAFALATMAAAPAQFYIFEPSPVFVVKGSKPKYYDPYYNVSKSSRGPVYYETKETKKKGNKTTKKVTIKDQSGHVVYKNKTVKKKKK